MIEWLVPASLFWTLAALYLGGFRLDIDDASGLRNLGGLLLTFVLFVAVWWAVRIGVGTALPAFAAIVAGSVVALLALPFSSRAAFRVFGIHIRPAAHGH